MFHPAFERILVTGGTGFIGRNVVDLLVADGFRPLVTAFDVLAPRTKADADFIQLDLTDTAKINDLIASYKPQIVLHLAGVIGRDDPTGKICHDINFTATVDLLNALDRNGVSRVVMLGTAAEYGGQPVPFREDMPTRPASEYAISKAKANQVALRKHVTNGFPVTILRVFTAYGHGQPPKMFLSQLITHGLLNRHFMMSDGLQKRDFVHVKEAARAIKASMSAENAVGRIINIAGGQGVALRDLARKVWEICGADEDLLDIGAREKAGDDAFDTEADISLAEEILNWRPGPGIINNTGESVALSEMIQQMRLDAGK